MRLAPQPNAPLGTMRCLFRTRLKGLHPRKIILAEMLVVLQADPACGMDIACFEYLFSGGEMTSLNGGSHLSQN